MSFATEWILTFLARLTVIVAEGPSLVGLPGESVVSLRLMVLPHTICVCDDVFPLDILDPVLEFLLRDIPITILVNLVDNFTDTDDIIRGQKLGFQF